MLWARHECAIPVQRVYYHIWILSSILRHQSGSWVLITSAWEISKHNWLYLQQDLQGTQLISPACHPWTGGLHRLYLLVLLDSRVQWLKDWQIVKRNEVWESPWQIIVSNVCLHRSSSLEHDHFLQENDRQNVTPEGSGDWRQPPLVDYHNFGSICRLLNSVHLFHGNLQFKKPFSYHRV